MLAGGLSVVAAFVYTFGLALQQKANLVSPPGAGGFLATVRHVVFHPLFLLGFGLGVVGFLLHGVALALGSLTVVQVLQVSQIAFMVPLGAWVARVRAGARDALGAALVAVGLVGLLVALRPSEDASQGTVAGWITTALVGGAVLAGLFALAAVRRSARSALFGSAAGVLFGIEAATLKVASDDLADGVSVGTLLAPAVWATLVLAVAAVFVSNLALRAGSLSVAQSSLTIVTPIASTVIGVGVFGEDLELSAATVAIAVVATVAAVVGVVLLSRSSALAATAEPVPQGLPTPAV